MALPATGTATRDGSCCCGGDACGCTGDCEFAALPDVLCVDLSGLSTSCGCPMPTTKLRLRKADPEVAPCSYGSAIGGFGGGFWLDGCTHGGGVFVGGSMAYGCDGADPDATTTQLNIDFLYGGGCSNQFVSYLDAGTCSPFEWTFSGAWSNTFSSTGGCVAANFCPGSVTGTVAVTAAVGEDCDGEALMAATLKTADAPEPPCRWRGVELTGPERAALSLDHRKTWYLCGKPDFPRLGLPVTDCRTCKAVDMRCSKAGCTGYEPADVDGRPGV